MPRRKQNKNLDKYQTIFKRYKIVCNNSVNGGDCYGETYCDNKCIHKDFMCKIHNIVVCNCCYSDCLSCTYPEIRKQLD